MEIFKNHILKAYLALKSVPNCKVSFNYSYIWWRYATFSAITRRIFHFHLKTHCTDFVVEDEWPPNSPDLNPLDCYVWGAMLRRHFTNLIQSRRPFRCSGKFVAPENYSHTQQYGLGLGLALVTLWQYGGGKNLSGATNFPRHRS